MAIFRPLSRRHPHEPGPRLAEVNLAGGPRLIQDFSNRVRRGYVLKTGFTLDDGSSSTSPQVRQIKLVRGERTYHRGQVIQTGFRLDDGSSEVTRPATLICDLNSRIRRGYIRLGQQVKDEPAPIERIGGRVTKIQDLVAHSRVGVIYWIPQILDDGSSERTHPATTTQDFSQRYQRGRIVQSWAVKDEPPPGQRGQRPYLIKDAFERALLLKQGKVLWGAQILDDGSSPTLSEVRRTKRIEDKSPLNRLLPRGGRILWATSVRPDIDEPQLNRRPFRVQDLTLRIRLGEIYHLAGGAREAGPAAVMPGCLTLSDELVTTIALSDELVTTIALSDDCQ